MSYQNSCTLYVQCQFTLCLDRQDDAEFYCYSTYPESIWVTGEDFNDTKAALQAIGFRVSLINNQSQKSPSFWSTYHAIFLHVDNLDQRRDLAGGWLLQIRWVSGRDCGKRRSSAEGPERQAVRHFQQEGFSVQECAGRQAVLHALSSMAIHPRRGLWKRSWIWKGWVRKRTSQCQGKES